MDEKSYNRFYRFLVVRLKRTPRNDNKKMYDQKIMGSELKYYQEIIAKLERLVKREYFQLSTIGIQATIIVGILVFATFTILESMFHFSSVVRTILFFLFLLFSIGTFAALFVNPLLKYFNIFRKTDYHLIAKKAGKNFPFIKDELLNAMQLVSSNENKNNYSPSLINAAFFNVYNKTKSIEFESIVKFQKVKELFKYLAGITAVVSVLFIFIPSLRAAGSRLTSFNKEFIPPAKFTFEVNPGNATLTKGENVQIKVKVNGDVPKLVQLATKETEQTKFEYQNLKPDSTGLYNYNINSVRSSFKYFVNADGIESEGFNIEVIDRPVIKTLYLTLTAPRYSKIPQMQQKDNGSVTGLPGSKVELKISSTKELKKAEIIFADSSISPLKISGNDAGGNFRIKGDDSYKIMITDKMDNQNLSPITYSIKSLADQFPSIDILKPGENINLPNDNRVEILSKVSDDYGFDKLLLHYRISASKYKNVEPNFRSIELRLDKSKTEQEINYFWNLTDLQLTENDVITYYLEIFDNDNINGPKSAKSNSFTLRVPTLNELLTETNKTQDKAIDDLKETLEKAEDLKKGIQKITQDLKQDKKDITWQEKEKIEKTVEEFKKLQEKSDQIGKKIDELKQNLQQNNMLSPETMEKYSELQKLFDSISSEEMKKMMEQMQNALLNMDRQQVQQSMENMKFDEEQYKASIERTMNLLKRIKIEQKVNELLKRTGELAKKQEDLKNETKNNDLKNQDAKNELSKKQDEISKDLKDTKDQMDELSKDLSEMKDLPKDELDKINQQMQDQKNQQLSKDAQQQIQQNQKQMAMQNQDQISQNMQKLKDALKQFQQSITQKSQMQVFMDMMRLTDNLISLSKDQEELKKESQNTDPNSSSFDKNAEKQNNIQRALNKILQQMSDLSQKTFAITPEMGKALGDALRAMMRSLSAMQNRNGTIASQNQGEAMKDLNEAASLMKNSMSQMMNGQSGSGMMSMMQQFGQMFKQQMNLNNLTKMLQQQMGGQMTMEQQTQLQRLAEQQESIKKSLEQLNKEAKESGKSKSIAANLEKMLQDMQEIIKGMQTQKLDDDIVQKQEHILSKMLDAQKSINERDFEKNRESFTGKNIAKDSPAELNLNSQKGKDKIKDELNRAVQEGYTKDYEELIRKYYEALQKLKSQN